MAFVVFVVLSLVCVASVSVLVISRDRARGALSLVLAFAALGGIYGLLGAPFVAAIQVLVYAGAIMVLFLFVIMMVDQKKIDRNTRLKRILAPAFVLTAGLIVELSLAVRGSGRAAGDVPPGGAGTSALGSLLMGRYLYAFEITSVLIVAALVGAIALAGKKEPR